ncbi:hypothetical protein NE237_019701 [Protea cynaroides]|uniref:Uncharacterized protein n=1 Tax=Protea cynaroides TaxID=273540 RepID=A0A9Q0K1L9_9MAGN|nr:hypothetical protein NE237_019701 [Protea cynaroides]
MQRDNNVVDTVQFYKIAFETEELKLGSSIVLHCNRSERKGHKGRRLLCFGYMADEIMGPGCDNYFVGPMQIDMGTTIIPEVVMPVVVRQETVTRKNHEISGISCEGDKHEEWTSGHARAKICGRLVNRGISVDPSDQGGVGLPFETHFQDTNDNLLTFECISPRILARFSIEGIHAYVLRKRMVIDHTSIRMVHKTFEDCKTVRSIWDLSFNNFSGDLPSLPTDNHFSGWIPQGLSSIPNFIYDGNSFHNGTNALERQSSLPDSRDKSDGVDTGQPLNQVCPEKSVM